MPRWPTGKQDGGQSVKSGKRIGELTRGKQK
jgi:hypothetical protein